MQREIFDAAQAVKLPEPIRFGAPARRRGLIAAIAGYFRTRQRIARDSRALGRLSGHMQRDVGLDQCEIGQIRMRGHLTGPAPWNP